MPIIVILCGLLGNVIFCEISTLTSHNLAFSITEDERKKLVRKFSRLSMGEVEKRSSGEWTQFMIETLDKMQQPIAHVIADIIIPVVLVIAIFVLNWRICFVNLVTLPLGGMFSFLMMGGYEEKSRNYQETTKNMNIATVEYIRGVQVIKAISATKFTGAIRRPKRPFR